MSPTFELQGVPILLGPLADSFPDWLKKQHYSQIFVLCDENTRLHCLARLLNLSDLSEKARVCEIQAGEPAKNLDTCKKIWQVMLEMQLDRKGLVINLGGGVIGDMGGFCAATWKRGLDFVQIPTTLLAMTDAAIGGKTGIDFQGIKNTIGVFQQPAAVFVDPVFLETLPKRALHSGYAEVIKHAVIGAPTLTESLHSKESLNPSNILNILQQSIAVKVRIVAEDPLEKGLRMLLNFGHTIGHALESWYLDSENPLTHGEAIYIGMICETKFANRDALLNAVKALGQNHFPHRKIPESAFPAIWALMQQDKKNSSGTVRMTVPDEKPYSLRYLEPQQRDIDALLRYYNTLA